MIAPRLFLGVLIVTIGVLSASAQPVQVEAGTEVGDYFGASSAISGDYLVIGAPSDNEKGADAGAVYLFKHEAQGWKLVTKLTAPDATPGANFGFSVALREHLLVVGASTHNRPFVMAGAAYVFEEVQPGKWAHLKTLQAPNPAIGGVFGGAVAIVRDQVLVGAMGQETEYKDVGGKAYLFRRHLGGQDAWGLVDVLEAPDGGYGDGFGSTVTISDSLLVVGARTWYEKYENPNAIYLFRPDKETSATWQFQEKLETFTGPSLSQGGNPLVLRGTRIAVGVPMREKEVRSMGSVYLYDRNHQNGWALEAQLQASDGVGGDRFGASVAMNDTMIVVGAPWADGVYENTGALYVFSRQEDQSWRQTAKLRAPLPTGSDEFGFALGIKQGLLVAGAPGARFGAGVAYQYDLSEPFDAEAITFNQFGRLQGGLWRTAVSAILQDREGYIWFGSLGIGLNRYDGYEMTPYVHTPPDSNSLSSNVVLALLEDQQGRLWIGTQDGLDQLDRRTNQVIRHPLEQDTRYGRQSIVALLEDRDGTVWTGTNGRLYRLRQDNEQFEEYLPFSGLPVQLNQTYISGIQQDQAGHLLVLAKNLREHDASLYKIDLDQDIVTRYGLSQDWGVVGPLLVDSENNIWVNISEPVALMPDEEGVLHPEKAYFEPEAWVIFEDDDGAIWVGTPEGYFRRSRADSVWALEQITETLNQSPTNFVRSFGRMHTGDLLIGTSAGVYQTHRVSSAIRTESSLMPMVLSAIQVSNREGIVDVPAYGLDALHLSYQDYNVAFEYAALGYQAPLEMFYQYQLEGYDRDWVEAGSRRFAMYTNVPHGSYTFRVRSSLDGQTWASEGLELPLIITPPFWKAWWFQFLVGAVLIGLLAAFYRYRVAKLLEVERLRLRIAGDLHDDLSSNLSGIALMSEMVQHQETIGRNERRQLTQIAQTARKMVEDLRDIVWFVDPSHDDLDDLLLKMKDVAATMLQGMTYSVKAPDDIASGTPSMDFRRQLLMIYKEILHNIVRHAKATRVDIRMRRQEKLFVLEVADDGIGFEESLVQEGHGMKSLRLRAAALGGSLKVTSQPGAGTHVEFSARMA